MKKTKFNSNINLIIFDFFGVIYNNYGINLDLLDLILKLKKFNDNLKVVILSNIETNLFENFKLKFNLEKYFDNFYLSDKIGYLKPNIDAFRYVLEKELVLPNKTIFIDDSLENVLSAKRLGINSYQYLSFEQILYLFLELDLLEKGK